MCFLQNAALKGELNARGKRWCFWTKLLVHTKYSTFLLWGYLVNDCTCCNHHAVNWNAGESLYDNRHIPGAKERARKLELKASAVWKAAVTPLCHCVLLIFRLVFSIIRVCRLTNTVIRVYVCHNLSLQHILIWHINGISAILVSSLSFSFCPKSLTGWGMESPDVLSHLL